MTNTNMPSAIAQMKQIVQDWELNEYLQNRYKNSLNLLNSIDLKNIEIQVCPTPFISDEFLVKKKASIMKMLTQVMSDYLKTSQEYEAKYKEGNYEPMSFPGDDGEEIQVVFYEVVKKRKSVTKNVKGIIYLDKKEGPMIIKKYKN